MIVKYDLAVCQKYERNHFMQTLQIPLKNITFGVHSAETETVL